MKILAKPLASHCLFIFGCVGSSLLQPFFSLVAESGPSLVEGLLTTVAFPVAEPRLQDTWASHVFTLHAARGPQSTGSISGVSHRLSCSMASGVFLDQASKPCLLHWQADSLPLSHQGSPAYTLKVLNLEKILHPGNPLSLTRCFEE